MRLVISILAVLVFSSGCFVWDEIEKGRKLMAEHEPDRPEQEEASASLDGGSGPPKSARDRLADYYAKQRAKAQTSKRSSGPAEDVGQCRIGNSTHFTRRSDCDLRGGTFR